MSGFEVAGVVLGSFPLLIEALKFYAEERGVRNLTVYLNAALCDYGVPTARL